MPTTFSETESTDSDTSIRSSSISLRIVESSLSANYKKLGARKSPSLTKTTQEKLKSPVKSRNPREN